MKFNSPIELMNFLRENEGKRYAYEKSNWYCTHDEAYTKKGESAFRYVNRYSNIMMHFIFQDYNEDWREVREN
jgi:hypothetical protein